MIFISDKAKVRVDEMWALENLSPAHFIRVSVTSGGCSGLSYNMSFDNEVKTDDEIFEDRGIKIAVDARSLMYVIGTTLEFSDGLNGKGFYFENPNASRTCSCGDSFCL
ncbi:MAG: iron-sulfur cluster assembly accessory protein [Chitinophagales bacterium]|nr:iron-sulfur cluster assembly accessory protein [Chitinophagales bacterium]